MILKCTSCNELTPNFITFNPNDEIEDQGATCNFQYKCKGCKRSTSILAVKPSAKEIESRVINFDQKNASSCIVAVFDCRGCEIEAVSPQGQWEAENFQHEKKWVFEWKVDEEFAEYDEEIGGLATISAINLTVERG